MHPIAPSKIVVGGCLLAFSASFLNTGFLLSTGTSVSHLTGDIARIGSGLSSFGESDELPTVRVTVATLGFILGAVISGFLLHHPALELRKPYGRILAALGLCIIAAHGFYLRLPILSIGIAGAVCGAQNALASRYRGVVLRTTHLTGLFTDLGIHLGMKLRGHRVESWKLWIPVFITFSFMAGAVVSSIFVMRDQSDWMLAAGVGYLIGGIVLSLYKRITGIGEDVDHGQ
ncbi:MAG: YoaK family protein [Verrucomicrobiales bacterium]|nr:YoaK family protein [Verrucomicrobiales bacterium]